jgi:hypothetical protein
MACYKGRQPARWRHDGEAVTRAKKRRDMSSRRSGGKCTAGVPGRYGQRQPHAISQPRSMKRAAAPVAVASIQRFVRGDQDQKQAAMRRSSIKRQKAGGTKPRPLASASGGRVSPDRRYWE